MRIPAKLTLGDEIRVIAPSRSAQVLKVEMVEQTKILLERLGFRVSFGAHIFECVFSTLHPSCTVLRIYMKLFEIHK